MSSPRKSILVTGATGKQGGALIEHLLAAPDTGGFNIVAVTRDASTPRAQKLAAHFNVVVVAGDLDDADAIFANVQVNSDAEEAQGKALIDAAVAHGVRHLVYSSGDRGGPARSPHNPTAVKNFAAKFAVEQHLGARAMETGMTFTILRPVTFLENLGPDVHGRGFARMWEQMGDRKLQFVSTRDIGWFAAQAFLRPDEHAGAAPTLVGDELTQRQADELFKAAVGSSMPLAPCPVASAVKFFLKGTVGDMFRWFEHEGYGGDVAACRGVYPEIKDFKGWIEENKGQWMK